MDPIGVWTPNGPSTLISPDQPLQKEEQGTLSEVSWSLRFLSEGYLKVLVFALPLLERALDWA